MGWLYRTCRMSCAAGLLLSIAAGCSQDGVANWPAPSFNGPLANQSGSSPMASARPTSPNYSHTAPSGIPQNWIPLARPRDWQYIVIHHSATTVGGAKRFDRDHRERGFDELGYDFVIGNGTDTRDGQIEVGPRWPVQKWGAHAGTPDERYNNYGIGICLVGNFDIQYPTHAQLESLAKLVAYLQTTYHIPADRVIGHRDVKPTDCPGRHLTDSLVRRLAERQLAAWGISEPKDSRMAGELLQPSAQ